MIKNKNAYKIGRKPSLGIKMWSVTVLTITALVFTHANGSNLEAKLNKRIIGGVDADISEFPYLLSLERDGLHRCGATILKSNVALTAAHCYYPKYEHLYTVRAGSHFRHVGGQVANVCHFRVHKKFNSITLDYDVAVALLADHLHVGLSVRLPSRGFELPVRSVCLASGWGALYDGHTMGSDRLQKVELYAISRESCQTLNQQITHKPNVTSRMICTYVYKKDTCQGDSGGPLMSNGVQVGITSWSNGCAQHMVPAVFTNIGNPEIYDFIMYSLNYK